MTAFRAAVIAIRIGRYIASFVGASRTMMRRMVVQSLDTHRRQQVADKRKDNLYPLGAHHDTSHWLPLDRRPQRK
jgi:hypothetical protein